MPLPLNVEPAKKKSLLLPLPPRQPYLELTGRVDIRGHHVGENGRRTRGGITVDRDVVPKTAASEVEVEFF